MSRIVGFAIAVAGTAVLSACYVIPERLPDGRVIYQTYPLPPSGMPPPPAMSGMSGMSGASSPVSLPVRLLIRLREGCLPCAWAHANPALVSGSIVPT